MAGLGAAHGSPRRVAKSRQWGTAGTSQKRGIALKSTLERAVEELSQLGLLADRGGKREAYFDTDEG
jgi:hypothetical protein